MAQKYLLVHLEHFNHLNKREDCVSLEQLKDMGVHKLSLGLSFGAQEYIHPSSLDSLPSFAKLHTEFAYEFPLCTKKNFAHKTAVELTEQVQQDLHFYQKWTGSAAHIAFCGESSENPHYNQVLQNSGLQFGGDPQHVIDFTHKLKYRAPVIPLKIESWAHRLFRKTQFDVLQSSMERFDYLRLAISANSLLHPGIANALHEFLTPVLEKRTLLHYGELQGTLDLTEKAL